MNQSKLNAVVETFKLDKSTWKVKRFGDVAIQQKKSVDRDKTDLTRYVKGEHMGSEDIHLREWGELTDEYLGPAFIRYFEEGDILYGSRRTYLKKVVVAPFEGITSNTTFVIKANESKIDKRLLPYIMLSDDFTDHSIKNSKGSVNPYINWKDLANYEFLLPPKEEQAKIAELLWAMDEVIEREKQLLETLNNSKSAYSSNLFRGNLTNERNKIGNLLTAWKHTKLSNHAIIKGRIGWRGLKQSEYVENGPYLIAGKHITEGQIEWNLCDKITEGRYQESLEIALQEGDVIFSKDGAIGNPALVREMPGKATINSTMMLIRPNNTLNSDYFFQIMKSAYFERLKYRCLSGSAIPHIFQGDMKNFEFPLPPLKEQIRIGEILKTFDDKGNETKNKISSSHSLQKSLINQVF